MRNPWNRNSGGSTDSKGSNTSLTERQHTQQKVGTGQGNKSLGKPNEYHQVPGRYHQPPKYHQHPHRPHSAGPEKEGVSIFDKWVEFRDKYLAGKIDSGFRKLGYTGKFVAKSITNSKTVNDLKDKAIQEGWNLKDKIVESGTSLKDRFRIFSKEKYTSGKDIAKEKLEHSSQALKGRLLEGKDIVKEKAHEGYEAGKDVLKDKFSHGKDVAKEKIEHGSTILKDKLGQGTEALKGVVKEQMQKGSGGLRDTIEHGSHVLKDKMIHGKDVISETLKNQAHKGGEKVKEKVVDASKASAKTVNKVASNAYDSVSSAPQMVTQKVTRFSRKAGIYVFLGVTTVAFAAAFGSKLPQAFFDYQLKKRQMEIEQQREEKQRVEQR